MENPNLVKRGSMAFSVSGFDGLTSTCSVIEFSVAIPIPKSVNY